MDILKTFSTQSLLSLALVCRRFHSLIVQIIRGRLLLAASPHGYNLILECYHPSAKSTEPHLVCEYLGTPGLAAAFQETDASPHASSVGQLNQLRELYSCFRPARQVTEGRILRTHPAGEVVRLSDLNAEVPGDERPHGDPIKNLVSHSVNLDSHEHFSQLCVVTHLVQLGPRSGIFYSIVNIADGVVRIFRRWLAENIKSLHPNAPLKEDEQPSGQFDQDEISRTLWVDSYRNTGVLVRIKERKVHRDVPLLSHKDDDPAVSYVLEYEGMHHRSQLIVTIT